jgi:hypothetical protein
MMDFRYEPRTDHLLVEVTGAFDPPAARSATEKMVSICREQSLKRVMVDARGLREVLSLADRFDLVSFVTEQRAPIRIAVLVSGPQANINASQAAAPPDPSSPLLTTASAEEAASYLGLATQATTA